MRVLTLLRAASWVGVVIAGWSLNVVWGADSAVGNGPPAPWERHVVGASLLAAVAAAVISIAGRKGKPPGPVPRLVALAAAAGAVAIALYLRQDAHAKDFAHLLAGDGWLWLTTGTALCLVAVAGVALLRRAKELSRKSRGRRRGGGR